MTLDVLAFVEGSPAAVAAHDRAAWVGLFTANARVNDPVGSRPHVGTAAIERFYDTFIAPNVIRFDVRHDVVCGQTVFRDLTILTTMRSGLTLGVPMHLRYDVVVENGAPKIDYLAAHWELAAMIGQMLRSPILGARTSLTLTAKLIRNQGLGGTLGFLAALRSVGHPGKRAAADYLSACGYHWSKLIAAGRTVTASLEVDGRPAVAQFDFDRRGRVPRRVEVCTGQMPN